MGVLKSIFNGTQMNIRGNDAYGYYQGFPVAARQNSDNNGLLIRISFHCEEREDAILQLADAVKRRGNELKNGVSNLVSCEVDSKQSVEIRLKNTFRDKTAADNGKTVLDAILRLLVSQNCTAGCEGCGQEVQTSWYQVSTGIPRCFCDDCNKRVIQACEREDTRQKEIQVNYLKGTLFALGGAIIAALIYVLVLRAGYILMSIMLPFVPILCFQAGGKKVDKLGAIICAAISLVVFYYATRFGFVWRIQSIVNDYSVGEIWKMLKMLCDEVPEVGKAYTECMIKGYGIAALISVILCGVAFFDKGVTKVKKL